jgi:hypothetical protein|tara:strand:+ start:437 stop:763 length:327 start_codon:yes stop_codon:yes gene_type:complete
MIIETMTKQSFRNEFMKVRKDSFSYEGLEALFEHLEDLSEGMEENIEFDPIALCCEFNEYENIRELAKDYSYLFDAPICRTSERMLFETIQNHTWIITFKGGIIIQAF